MTSNLVLKTPLVSVVRSESSVPNHTRVSYYVNDLLIMDMDVLSDIVASTGPLNLMLLTQLLVTPHEHLASIADILSLAHGKETEGPRWESALAKAKVLLEGPQA